MAGVLIPLFIKTPLYCLPPSLFFKFCPTPPSEKSHPLFLSNIPLKSEILSSPSSPFENLVGGSPPPPTPRKGSGCQGIIQKKSASGSWTLTCLKIFFQNFIMIWKCQKWSLNRDTTVPTNVIYQTKYPFTVQSALFLLFPMPYDSRLFLWCTLWLYWGLTCNVVFSWYSDLISHTQTQRQTQTCVHTHTHTHTYTHTHTHTHTHTIICI